MKAIQATSFGGPDVLSLVLPDTPLPGPGTVLIQVAAAGAGTVDVLIRKGLYPGGINPGFIPGMEVAGTVIATGDQVAEDWIGKRVYAMTMLGGYATHLVVPQEALVPLPGNLSFEDAVGLGINALVAQYSLQRAALTPGDALLVRGAGGGIGSMLVQLALAGGYRVTATGTTPAKRAALERIGVGSFFSVTTPEAAGQAFKAIIDPVAGPDLDRYVAQLADNGTYVLNGAAAGFPPDNFGLSWLSRFQRSLTLACFSLDAIPPQEARASLQQLFRQAEQGQLQAFIGATFALEDAAEAHRVLESGSVFGKIVLQV